MSEVKPDEPILGKPTLSTGPAVKMNAATAKTALEAIAARKVQLAERKAHIENQIENLKQRLEEVIAEIASYAEVEG